MTKSANAFDPQIKTLQAQLDELKQRRTALARELAADPVTAIKRKGELTSLNTDMAACSEQIDMLLEAQQLAADQARIDEFEKGRTDTEKAKDDALATATARARLGGRIDATLDTLGALLLEWENLSEQIRASTREVAARTKPPAGRAKPIHDRMHSVSNLVRFGGATNAMSHKVMASGLGSRGIQIDLILGNGFRGPASTIADEAVKGVKALEYVLQKWITEASSSRATTN